MLALIDNGFTLMNIGLLSVATLFDTGFFSKDAHLALNIIITISYIVVPCLILWGLRKSKKRKSMNTVGMLISFWLFSIAIDRAILITDPTSVDIYHEIILMITTGISITTILYTPKLISRLIELPDIDDNLQTIHIQLEEVKQFNKRYCKEHYPDYACSLAACDSSSITEVLNCSHRVVNTISDNHLCKCKANDCNKH